MTTVAALVPDLMDRSRISSVAASVVFVGLAELRDLTVDLVVVDLDRVGDPAALRQAAPQSRIIGFGSHVDDTTLDLARAAGIDEVLPRSVFFRRVGELLAWACADYSSVSGICHPVSLTLRGSKNTQSSGQANGTSSFAPSLQR